MKKRASGNMIKSKYQPDQHGNPNKMAYAYKPDVSQFGVEDRHDRRGQEPGSQHHPCLRPGEKEDGGQVDQWQPCHPWPPNHGHFENVSEEVD